MTEREPNSHLPPQLRLTCSGSWKMPVQVNNHQLLVTENPLYGWSGPENPKAEQLVDQEAVSQQMVLNL